MTKIYSFFGYRYLHDKEFKQESIKKIYSNSLLKQIEGSRERKNNFQEESDQRQKSKSKKPVKKLYLIQEKENLNTRKKKTKKEIDNAAKKNRNAIKK